jgi:hypothetical protein
MTSLETGREEREFMVNNLVEEFENDYDANVRCACFGRQAWVLVGLGWRDWDARSAGGLGLG